MKTLLVLCFTLLLGFSFTTVSAQEDDPDIEVNLWTKQPITVDGNAAEWHEPLNNYNTATKLAFALANDQRNLYLIIESQDKETTRRIISGGLSLDINTSGKKRDGVKISLNHPLATWQHELQDTGLNVIQVSGFKNIPDGSLSIPNQEEIQVAAAFNKQKDYICELAVPLAQLNLKGNEDKAIAYNIKINKSKGNIEHNHEKGSSAGMGGGRRGMSSGGGMSGGHGRHSGGMGGRNHESVDQMGTSDFWIKYELAKPGDSFLAN